MTLRIIVKNQYKDEGRDTIHAGSKAKSMSIPELCCILVLVGIKVPYLIPPYNREEDVEILRNQILITKNIKKVDKVRKLMNNMTLEEMKAVISLMGYGHGKKFLLAYMLYDIREFVNLELDDRLTDDKYYKFIANCIPDFTKGLEDEIDIESAEVIAIEANNEIGLSMRDRSRLRFYYTLLFTPEYRSSTGLYVLLLFAHLLKHNKLIRY